LLFFGAWFLIVTPSVSAQEAESANVVEEQIPPASEDPITTAQQALTFEWDTGEAAPTSGTSVWAAVRMVLALALAAAAVYGVVFFIKRSSKQTALNDPFLKILASAHLGSNRYAHIVSVGSKAYLVGASDGGVSLIDEVDDKDILNAMLLEDSRKGVDEKPGRLNDFVSILRRFGLSVKQGGQSAENIRKSRERLKGL